MPHTFPPSKSFPWGALIGITAALSLFGAAQGFSYPLLTLAMHRQGLSSLFIGLSAAMMPLGMILSAPLAPMASDAIGERYLAFLCTISGAASFALIGYFQNAMGWFPLRFLLGFSITPLYILGEVWALSLAPDERRGQIMGIFNALVGVGYAAGPIVLTLVGSQGLLPFELVSGAFVVCGCMLFLLSPERSETINSKLDGASAIRFFGVAPILVVAVGVAAANQQSIFALLPVYATSLGMQEAKAAWLLAALSFGNILLQLPLGMLADRHGASPLIVTCAGLTSLSTLVASFLISSDFLWIALFLLGGVSYGVYTMTLVALGNRFSGSLLLAGNAAFALVWGMGGMIGAPAAGLAMQLAGPQGLPATIIAMSSMLVCLFALTRQRRSSEEASQSTVSRLKNRLADSPPGGE